MEAGTLRGSREEEREPLEGREAVAAAVDERKAERLTDEERESALAWFLEDDMEDFSPVVHTFQIDVGTPVEGRHVERWLDWTVRTLDLDTIDSIRQRARGGNRAQRRQGLSEVNEMQAAIGIVLASTVDPDLDKARQAKGATTPEEVLRHRFRHKPGLILQISAKVMEFSGYDDDDVREAVAAKNS